MHRYLGGTFLALALLILWSFSPAEARAQSIASSSADVSAYRTQLQNELTQIEGEIAQQQQALTADEAKGESLQNTIAILNAQIQSSKLAIQARDIAIEQLNGDIAEKEDTIAGLNSQLSAEKDSLAGILREKAELENTSLVVTLLSSESVSDFFSDLDTFDEINAGMQQSFTQISSTTALTQAQETQLEGQLTQENELRQAQALQEQQIENQQTQENQLLTETKGEEANYQALIAQNQQTAAQIRAALFSLTGSAAIPFGTALEYASLASQQTGIRPAFLLGIIAEESDLGENVGTGSYTTDMSPENIPIFLAITKSLGLDPAQVPVSAREWYGWGGAMGPAQFIPSTWALFAGYPAPLYQYDSSKDRIGSLTGDTPPNPWNAKDAFMAAALYLTDDGAAAQTPSAEFRAAMCYLTGCGNVDDQSLWFYGNQVLCNELKYQEDIDTINGTDDAAAMRGNALYYGQC